MRATTGRWKAPLLRNHLPAAEDPTLQKVSAPLSALGRVERDDRTWSVLVLAVTPSSPKVLAAALADVGCSEARLTDPPLEPERVLGIGGLG